ncbi:MAG TPA: MauE/DoxX family redox-associated membrane protein [Caulobacteraceae bacterium]
MRGFAPVVLIAAVIIAKLLLALVFAVASLAKFADRGGTRAMLTAFGVPADAAPVLAPILSGVELLVAISLLFSQTAWLAAIGAAVLLAAFIGAIAFNLARGRRPACNCFGQLKPAPIGPATLVRNLALIAAAAVLIGSGPARAAEWMLPGAARLTAPEALEALFAAVALALLGLMATLLLQMMRQQGRLLLRLEGVEALLAGDPARGAGETAAQRPANASGLPVGAPAPDFGLQNSQGSRISLEDLISAGRPVLLLFSNPNCAPCAAMAPEVEDWRREHSGVLDIVRVGEGAAADNAGSGQVLLQLGREVADAYQCWGTPGAVLVRADGTIGSWVAQGADDIRALVARAAAEAAAPHAPPGASFRRRTGLVIGETPPPMKLSTTGGGPLTLEAFLGRALLLLFWNPDCGFCQGMLDDLRRWDASPPPGAPTLIVFSSATAERNKEMGLSCLVLADAQGAGAVFGANGTPMAVRLDPQGRVASEVAAGADAVMELANGAASKAASPPRREGGRR